jgi:hypothetical protein
MLGNKPMGVTPKTEELKLRTGVNWQGALKPKGLKQGLGYWKLLAIELWALQYHYICVTCGGVGYRNCRQKQLQFGPNCE